MKEIDWDELLENGFGGVICTDTDNEGNIRVEFDDSGAGAVSYWVDKTGEPAEELGSAFTVRNKQTIEEKAYVIGNAVCKGQNLQKGQNVMMAVVGAIVDAKLLKED